MLFRSKMNGSASTSKFAVERQRANCRSEDSSLVLSSGAFIDGQVRSSKGRRAYSANTKGAKANPASKVKSEGTGGLACKCGQFAAQFRHAGAA